MIIELKLRWYWKFYLKTIHKWVRGWIILGYPVRVRLKNISMNFQGSRTSSSWHFHADKPLKFLGFKNLDFLHFFYERFPVKWKLQLKLLSHQLLFPWATPVTSIKLKIASTTYHISKVQDKKVKSSSLENHMKKKVLFKCPCLHLEQKWPEFTWCHIKFCSLNVNFI